ncbi:LysR family transcriptional regulator [Haloferula chungangensis]|uniref:LysR family transcriptional regulator n=1 Tax=Haloferula chungangensis TaxID=1048331 RepID=A0ABW2L451_9BACT
MELRHLRYFVMAAAEESISRAAARLNISQPAVSRQIRDLEEELGVPLFDRESSGLSLTEAGLAALPHAQELLRRAGDLKLAMEVFGKPVRKTLRVGFIETALPGFLASAMRVFNQRHDDVCIQIRSMPPLAQEKALREGEIDLALLGTPCPQLASEFRVEAIKKTPMAVVLPDDHLLSLRKSIDLSELANEPFVSLHEAQFPGRPVMLADLCGRAGFVADVRMKAAGLQEMLGLVAGGAGVGVLPMDVNLLPHTGVVFVKLRKPTLTLVSSAVWKRESETKELLDLIGLMKAPPASKGKK